MDKKITQTGISNSTFGDNAHIEITQIINILQEAKRLGIPINLPPTNVTLFAGRDDDLKRVHELLQKNQRVAVSAFVKGMGGVGKSELALQYSLRHLLTDYSGGICWLRANGGLCRLSYRILWRCRLGKRCLMGWIVARSWQGIAGGGYRNESRDRCWWCWMM